MNKLFKKINKQQLWFMMPFLFVLLILIIITIIAEFGITELPFIYAGF